MRLILPLVVLLSLCTTAWAQAWPTKPIRVISAVTPGNSGDTAMRMAIVLMNPALGQPLVIESRMGAGGQIAAAAAKSSAPDGYNILLIAPSFMTTAHMLKQPPYDPVRDFTAISKIIDVPSLFAVSAAMQVNSIKEFIEFARRNPGRVAYGSNGVGSFFHLMGEAFSLDAGIKMLHVPYGSGSVAVPVTDLANDRLQLYFPSYTSLVPVIQSPSVKVLAVLGRSRLKRLPEVPTMFEAFPSYTLVPSFFGLVGPAGLPPPIAVRLQTELRKALQDAAVSAKLEALGSTPVGNTPEEFAKELRIATENIGKGASLSVSWTLF